jgi:hypothetical protein
MFIDVAQLKALCKCDVIEKFEAIPEEIDNKKKWKLIIHHKYKDKKSVLISQKKEIRYWTQLNTVVSFVEELYPATSQLNIVLNRGE